MSNIMLERSRNVKQNLCPRFEFFDVPPYADYPLMERDKMTIAAGFKCKGGAVICADRELTYPGGKVFKPKTWQAASGKVSMVVAGAGQFAYLESAATKIVGRIAEVSNVDDARKVVRSSFDYVLKKEYFQKPGCPPVGVPFDLIVGVSTKNTVEIIRLDQGVMKARTDHPELAGSGIPIAQYFFDRYYLSSLSAQNAVILGAYVISSVKKSGLGCGGPTDLWLLQKGREAENLPIKYLDHIFNDLRFPFRDMLYASANLGLTDEQFDSELTRTVSLVKARREDYKKWKKPLTILIEELSSI